MRYLITVSYDGSKFYGFQRLKDKPSVQKSLEDALSILNHSPVIIKGAGRTDRGVHAFGQRCHFDLEMEFSADVLVLAMNRLLPNTLRVLDCKCVSQDFHARFQVTKKTYSYLIYLKEVNPFLNDYSLSVPYRLNIRRMKKAAKKLVGVHDFKNFVSGERGNSQAIIYQVQFQKRKDTLKITFVGKSFYRYMIRNLVGALLQIGQEKVPLRYIDDLLNPDIPLTPPTVSAAGLYLEKIDY